MASRPILTALAMPTTPKRFPALLQSFAYLDCYVKWRPTAKFRDWALDSGAFTAFGANATISLKDYTDRARTLLEVDPKLVEVFSLDVIGDWRQGLKNCQAMWKAKVPAIPCFHYGEPDDLLLGLARDYPKIALGGMVGVSMPKKIAWAKDCVFKVWPKAVHGFGQGSRDSLLSVPWHSTDASNWQIGPTRFGSWPNNMFGRRFSVPNSDSLDLRICVKYFLDLEDESRRRWANEMKEVDYVPHKV